MQTSCHRPATAKFGLGSDREFVLPPLSFILPTLLFIFPTLSFIPESPFRILEGILIMGEIVIVIWTHIC